MQIWQSLVCLLVIYLLIPLTNFFHLVQTELAVKRGFLSAARARLSEVKRIDLGPSWWQY